MKADLFPLLFSAVLTLSLTHALPLNEQVILRFSNGNVTTLNSDLPSGKKNEGSQGALCSLCHGTVESFQRLMLVNNTQNLLITAGIGICKLFNIQTPNVCEQIVPQFGPWAITVFAKAYMNPSEVCATVKACERDTKPSWEDWEIELPPQQIKLAKEKDEENFVEDDPEVEYIVHLSDWHYDPDYQEGYEADCSEPICCRPPHSPTPDIHRPAGKWGDYHCDMPYETLRNMLAFIPKVVPHINAVVLTGDQPPHDVWAETVETVLNVTERTAYQLNSKFGLAGVKVFPTIGNHEGAPINSFPTRITPLSTPPTWLYSALAHQWSSWVPTLPYDPNFLTAGFYSTKIGLGLRLISLNTNFFYRLNWWMRIRPKEEPDPEGMLTWLVKELSDAEISGEKVMIIGHMSPVDADGDHLLGRQFSRIVARFAGSIVGQFYGHSHFDEFQVLYDAGDEKAELKPIGVAYIGPSVTAFERLNPAFRVYEISSKTKEVLNHYTYTFDLKEANKPGNSPQWRLLYDAKSAYAMNDLSPQSWHDLTSLILEIEQPVFTNSPADQITTTTTSYNVLPNITDLFHIYSYLTTRNPERHFPNCIKHQGIQTVADWKAERSCRRKTVCTMRGGKAGLYAESEICRKHGKKAKTLGTEEAEDIEEDIEDSESGIWMGMLGSLVGMEARGATEDGRGICH